MKPSGPSRQMPIALVRFDASNEDALDQKRQLASWSFCKLSLQQRMRPSYRRLVAAQVSADHGNIGFGAQV